jgi:uracil-DNA glycosylase
MIPPAPWADLPFFSQHWPALRARLAQEPGWQPAPENVFRALALTPPDAIRAVILGQDPYPSPGRATGLAFAFPPGTPPRDSLRNILRELETDTGITRPGGDLTGWARQGVLLLNTVLTVPVGRPNGHATLGWQTLAAQILARAAARPAAFLLWGTHAQNAAAPHLNPTRHLILPAPHPSPLSARRGFFGSRPFSQTNAWLAKQDLPPIDWAA